METKGRKHGHGGARKGRVGAVEGLIQNDGTVGRNVLIRLRQAEAQRRSQAEEHQLLGLAAGKRGGILIRIGGRAIGVALAADEADVLAGIQNQVSPPNILRLRRAQAAENLVQGVVARYRSFGLIGANLRQAMGRCGIEITLEVLHHLAPGIFYINAQGAVPIEGRALQGLINKLHALFDIATGMAK